jgi:HPt (histidine-containing phosphotransfer) domain-containing protein
MVTDPRDPGGIQALLAAARAEFAASLPAKASELASLIARESWEDARRAAHKLRGSAGTFGFVEVGAACAAIEEALLAASNAPGADARAAIAAMSRTACAEADRAAGATEERR